MHEIVSSTEPAISPTCPDAGDTRHRATNRHRRAAHWRHSCAPPPRINKIDNLHDRSHEESSHDCIRHEILISLTRRQPCTCDPHTSDCRCLAINHFAVIWRHGSNRGLSHDNDLPAASRLFHRPANHLSDSAMTTVPPLTCARNLSERQRNIMFRHWLEPHGLWNAETNGPRGCLSVVWNRAEGTMTYEFLGKVSVRRPTQQ